MVWRCVASGQLQADITTGMHPHDCVLLIGGHPLDMEIRLVAHDQHAGFGRPVATRADTESLIQPPVRTERLRVFPP